MSLTWKSRTFVATATATLLTAAGVVALANAASGGTSAEPTSAPSVSTSPDTDELERSLDALLGQVDGLEAAVAAADVTDDNGGRRPAGASDDPTAGPRSDSDDLYDDDSDDAYDDHGDDAYDDDSDDDHDDDSDDHGADGDDDDVDDDRDED